MFHGAGGFYNLCYTLYEAPNRGMRICSMGPGDYDKEMLWQGNTLALEWWNQWVASSALGYGPEGHTLVGRGVVPSGQPLVLWVILASQHRYYVFPYKLKQEKKIWTLDHVTAISQFDGYSFLLLLSIDHTWSQYIKVYSCITGDGSKPWYLVNPKIAGKWMFIPLKMYL